MIIYFYDGSSLRCESLEMGEGVLIVDEYLTVFPDEIVRIVPYRGED